MPRRANGEGSLYKSIPRIDKKKNRDKEMCNTCKNCTDRSVCDYRKGTKKCEICLRCTDCLTYCDRFYAYKYNVAQATVNGKHKTVATGKKTKEVNKKKTEALSKIDNGKYVDKNSITVSQQLRNTIEKNLETEKTGENGYIRNIEAIISIENKCPKLASKKLQELTEDDILEILKQHKDNSQSVIEKAYDVLNMGINRAIKDKLLDEDNNPIKNIERTTILSNKDEEEAIPFTVEETKQLLEYIDKNENKLVSDRAHIDSKSMKNLIKLSFAFGTRCGELCAVDIYKHINFDKNKITIERTLTRNKKKQIIIGKCTKTGKKAKKKGKKDSREVPFDIIYSDEEVRKILLEQIEIAKNIKNNKDNLLFCNKDGSYIDVKHITRMFKEICRKAGVKLDLATGCHIHMTKHTAVTRLIELKYDIYAISKLVGTTRAVLEKTYAHILDTFVEDEIRKSKKVEKSHQLTLTSHDKSEDDVASNVIQFPVKKSLSI